MGERMVKVTESAWKENKAAEELLETRGYDQRRFVEKFVVDKAYRKRAPRRQARIEPKKVFPMFNKFQSCPQKPTSKSSGVTETTMSNQINFPVRQLRSKIPEHKRSIVKRIYSQIQTKKYSTSALDPMRNYLTVYEYTIKNQSIIWDYETGFVHLPGIWKAASENEENRSKTVKAVIVKLLESSPKELHQYIKRIRGGFLKIQGTWLPYDFCKSLARRFSYHIRYELVPLFGDNFPAECLGPTERGFGELKIDNPVDLHISLHSPAKRELNVNNQECVPRIVPPKHFDNDPEKPNRDELRDKLSVYEHSMDLREYTPDNMMLNGFPRENGFRFKRASVEARPQAYVMRSSPYILRLLETSPDLKQVSFLNYSYFPPADTAHCQKFHSHVDTPLPASHNDIIDIFNASRCLQTLRSENTPLSSTLSCEVLDNLKTRLKEMSSGVAPMHNRSGISYILQAANVSEKKHQADSSRKDIMSIQGLLI